MRDVMQTGAGQGARPGLANLGVLAIGCYVAAKVFEELDGAIHGLGGLLSGHTLKHLSAAAGAWLIYRMLVRRQPVAR